MPERITNVAANENVLSPDGRILYVVGTDATVRAYDVETRALLNSYRLGTRLGGADVTPDGRYLVVAEREPAYGPLDQNGQRSTTVSVHRLEIQTGQVRTYTTEPGFGGGPFFDVAVLADGTALISQSYNGSGWNKLRALNLESGTFTVLSQSVRQDSVLSLSDDRRLVFVGEPNISNAEIDLYRAGAGGVLTLVGTNGSGQGFNRGIQDLSGDGRLAANFVPGAGLLIFDGQLRFVRNLANEFPAWQSGRIEGLAFDATGQNLFVLDGDRRQVFQIETQTWTQVKLFNLDPYQGEFAATGRFGNNLTLTNDGRYLIVQTDSNVQRISTNESAAPSTVRTGPTDWSEPTGATSSTAWPGRTSSTAGSGRTSSTVARATTPSCSPFPRRSRAPCWAASMAAPGRIRWTCAASRRPG